MQRATRSGKLVFANGWPFITNQGELVVGERVRFWYYNRGYENHRVADGKLLIGDDCYINGSIIRAHKEVCIGNGVFLAPGSILSDTTDWWSDQPATAAITVGDHAWLATRCTIMPRCTLANQPWLALVL
ncbi:MAG: hypothetical protein R2795_26085 [Saprospiraceae bacterium]